MAMMVMYEVEVQQSATERKRNRIFFLLFHSFHSAWPPRNVEFRADSAVVTVFLGGFQSRFLIEK